MVFLIAFLWLISLMVAVSQATVLSAPLLYSLYPNKGSFAGGTYLVIKGVGWSRNGTAGTTSASVTINGVTRPCRQNQGVILDSTDTNFVCWTPPIFDTVPGGRIRLPEYIARVDVFVKDLAGNLVQAAWSEDSSGRFLYKHDATPVILFASLGGYAGSVLKAYGTLKADDGSK